MEVKVLEILSNVLKMPKEEILLETQIRDLKIDSLDLCEIFMKIEDEFGVCLDIEEAMKIKYVKDFISIIEKGKVPNKV